MLQLRETRIARSIHEQVMSGIAIQEEGMALVYASENGETKVAPSSGAAGEIFAGVSLARNVPPTVLPMVQEGKVGSNNRFALARTPMAGQLLVKANGVALAVVTATPTAGEVQVSGSDLIFNNRANQNVFVQYLYVPNMAEARIIIGDQPSGGLAANVMDSVGTLKDATFGTNMFDASQDWSSTLTVATGANGMFVPGTATNSIANAVVKSAPNAENAFLVLSIRVA